MNNKGKSGQSIKSDETLFAIIESLRELNGAGVTEIADHLDLAKSTVHKHLVTLRRHRYVAQKDGEYRLGLQFLNTGVYVRNQYEVYHAAKDRIDRLADETGEAVWLIVRENEKGFFLHGKSKNDAFEFDSTVGNWVPLHANAAGKAILAHLPRSEVADIIDAQGLPERTENTLTTRNALHEELDRTRERGYAKNLEEDMQGLHAFAAPIIRRGDPLAAVTVAGAANRVSEEYFETDLHEALLEAVNDIELRLEYS